MYVSEERSRLALSGSWERFVMSTSGSATRSESATPPCAVEGCERGGKRRRGLCNTHYHRWWRTGDPGPAELLLKPHVTAHGTVNEYNNYGCRCERCKAAMAEFQREFFYAPCEECGAPTWGRAPSRNARCVKCAAAAQTIPIEERHGTEVGYSKGCRCADCRRASAQARRTRRRSNLEAANAYDRAYKARRRAVA